MRRVTHRGVLAFAVGGSLRGINAGTVQGGGSGGDKPGGATPPAAADAPKTLRGVDVTSVGADQLTVSAEPVTKGGLDAPSVVAQWGAGGDVIPIENESRTRVLEAAAVGRMPNVSVTSHPIGDRSLKRATGLWQVSDVVDTMSSTVNFRHIDEIETSLQEEVRNRADAIVPYAEEQKWKHHLMFTHRFQKTPKHLTWKELGQEIECLDCVIDLDEHKPEDAYTLNFYFRDRKHGSRDLVWSARNDVASSEGLSDLLAAVGSCLGRSDVHRTIRFDDGRGRFRELNIKKNSKFTSEVVLAFRPEEGYDAYKRAEHDNTWEDQQNAAGMPSWGYHPSLMDAEYRDVEEAESTYHLNMSAHAFAFIVVTAVDRLLQRPLQDFYRPSKIVTGTVKRAEDIGLSQAMLGWLGCEERTYPHYHPLEAIEAHWFGPDAPFTLAAIMNKLRSMTYLKPKNPEFHSWLGARTKDTLLAVRNVNAKLAGAGASPLFAPSTHNASMNMMLPKPQRRSIATTVSLSGFIGMPDETRKLDQLRAIAETGKLPASSFSGATAAADAAQSSSATATSDTVLPGGDGAAKKGAAE